MSWWQWVQIAVLSAFVAVSGVQSGQSSLCLMPWQREQWLLPMAAASSLGVEVVGAEWAEAVE